MLPRLRSVLVAAGERLALPALITRLCGHATTVSGHTIFVKRRYVRLRTALSAIVIAFTFVVGIGVTQSLIPSTAGAATAPCLPDPSAAIAATPAGGTWNGGGQCYTTDGIRDTTSLVGITNATFSDPLLGKPGKPTLGFPPVLELWGTTGVTISNVTIEGANPTGHYNAKLVGEAGIKLVMTSDTTITNTAVNGTFGDCLEVFANPPKYVTPNTGLTVNGLTEDNCGRMNMSLSDVYGATLNNVTAGNNGYDSVDFESDLALGAGNVTITNSTFGGTIFEEKITGPILFDHDTTNRVIAYGVHLNAYPITFENGTLTIPKRSAPPGIWITDARSLTFRNETFTRSQTAAKALLWGVNPAGSLTITDSRLSAPLGLASGCTACSGNTGG